MRFAIFGLTMSSSWGNGHATLWRGLVRALTRMGHHITFFERDVPYYAAHRDLFEIEGGKLHLYSDWESVAREARRTLERSDAAIVTSYCPDAVSASRLVLDAKVALRVFYDLDTPVTLERLEHDEPIDYLPPEGLGGFDLALSFTGGSALCKIMDRLGAKRAFPLYGSVDPDVHRPTAPHPDYRADLSYLGTYAADRQEALSELFLAAAERLSERRFLIGGSLYPSDFPWGKNIYYVHHVAPSHHPAFYSSSKLTLNVTRQSMAKMGYCPSGRLFEAAASGVPILSDTWEGLDRFFTEGQEILIARRTEDTVAALSLSARELEVMARTARERVLEEHSAKARAKELLHILESLGPSRTLVRGERADGVGDAQSSA